MYVCMYVIIYNLEDVTSFLSWKNILIVLFSNGNLYDSI